MQKGIPRGLLLVVLCSPLACGDDADAADHGSASAGETEPLGDDPCELQLNLQGALEWSTPSAPACAIPFGGKTGIFMGYIFIDGEVQYVDVDVPDIREGETGTFEATVSIRLVDDRRWIGSSCTVDVREHVPDPETDDDFSRGFIIEGTGACTEPALPADEADSPLEVVPFAFRFPPRWP